MAARLQRLGIVSLLDLLFHLPTRYQDRSQITPIANLHAGCSALVCGSIEYTDIVQRGRPSVLCRIGDGSGFLMLRFYHFSAQQAQQLRPGELLGCYGDIRYGYNGSLEMIHPEYRLVQQREQLIDPCLLPVYPLAEGISQTKLRKTVQQALERCAEELRQWPEWMSKQALEQAGYPSLAEAIRILHQPPVDGAVHNLLTEGDHPARQRLVLDELVAHHLALVQNKQRQQQWQAPRFVVEQAVKAQLIGGLPFQLTGAQQRVIKQIERDCKRSSPMMRLLQGDVGCGKTVVAAFTAWLAVQSGYQVALMAPTELLAEQHFQNFQKWFAHLGVVLTYLSGQLKGKSRADAVQQIASGEAQIVIGTHALFQDAVEFQRLGLVMIDEQHRFGVNQRLALRQKGQIDRQRPHQLVMTATPIPRTLAMMHYADLDVSVIDELPPGRQPVTTSAIGAERRAEVLQRIHHWIQQGKQAYWVCTLIEESELLQCEAAEKTARQLTESMPEIRVGLVHGRMKSAEKDAIMQAFKSGQLDLLVATTVIEVGVDVPNASLMVIENAERLGLSQLHQLRGRVGRGTDASFCLLLYQGPLSAVAKQRLAIIRQHHDGFVIAEQDLLLRGPGELLGSRQAGQMQFKLADLQRDQALVEQVPELAEALLRNHPEWVEPLIRRWIASPKQAMHDMA